MATDASIFSQNGLFGVNFDTLVVTSDIYNFTFNIRQANTFLVHFYSIWVVKFYYSMIDVKENTTNSKIPCLLHIICVNEREHIRIKFQ